MNETELTSLLAEYDENLESIKGMGRGWNKFRGMVFQNLLVKYLSKHVPDGIRFTDRSYVEGFSAELDLVLLKRDATAIGVTSAYRKEDVLGVFEIKASGIFFASSVAEEELRTFASRIEKGTGQPFAYITRRENHTLEKATRQALGDRAFILSMGYQKTPTINYDEWTRLTVYIERLSGKRNS